MKHIKFLAVFLILSYSIFALTADEEKLFQAINSKNSADVSSILSASGDIDINILDNEGYSPLHRAVYNSDINTINELLKVRNINIDSKLDMKVSIDNWFLGGSTPMILAAFMGNADIVSLLLDNKANIRARDGVDGAMAIHLAAANGRNDVIKVLLAKDPQLVNIVDNRDNTPLHWAAMKDKKDTIELLMENGADIEAKDADGWTPLHYAAAFSSVDTVQTLVDLGADKESKAKDGSNPMDYARQDDVKNYLAGNDNIKREDAEEENLEEETVLADNNTAEEEMAEEEIA